MKTKKMIETLQRFNDGDITEEEAVDLLENCEPFVLYSTVIKMHMDGFNLDEGDLPEISKIYVSLYKEETDQLIKELDKSHPIKKLISEHKKIDNLLDILKSILDSVDQEINEESNFVQTIEDEEELKKIEIIMAALKDIEKHFIIEENLIFPLWNQKGRIGDTIILEDEHEEIKEKLEILPGKPFKRKENWKTKDWKEFSEKIDKLIGQVRFHTFHEEDMFYPMVVDDLDENDFKKIKQKMDKVKKQSDGATLADYVSYVSP